MDSRVHDALTSSDTHLHRHSMTLLSMSARIGAGHWIGREALVSHLASSGRLLQATVRSKMGLRGFFGPTEGGQNPLTGGRPDSLSRWILKSALEDLADVDCYGEQGRRANVMYCTISE